MPAGAPPTSSLPRVAGSLGIICGGGKLPLEVARAARAAGNTVFLIGITGEADTAIEAFPHAYVRWGEVGKLFALLGEQGCSDIVVIGKVRRPSLRQVHFDFGALRAMPRFLAMLVGGDDKILSSIVSYIEERGLRVLGAQEFLPHLIADAGRLGRITPGPAQEQDAALGFKVAGALGAFDIGQAVVVEGGYVLTVEAAEGTDVMLTRAGALRRGGETKSGVLVKRAKPGQELRIDMPTVGVRTVTGAAEAGLAGIAIEAGRTLLADYEDVIEAADKAGLFLLGLSADQNGND